MGTLVGVVSDYETPKGKSPFAKCKVAGKKVQVWSQTKEGDTNVDHALLYKAALESRSVKVITSDEEKTYNGNRYTQRTVDSAEWHEAVGNDGDLSTAQEAAVQYSKPAWKRDPETQQRIEAQWAVGNAAQVLAIESSEPAGDGMIQSRALTYLSIVDQVVLERASTSVSSTLSESETVSE